jgi:hypothetical protein
VRAGVGIPRRPREARDGVALVLSSLALSALLAPSCASRFGPPAAGQASAALERWGSALARAGGSVDANVLYDATLSQGLLKTDGTLAVRLRAGGVEGSLAGPFGSPIATYENGELTGEKIRPVVLPARQLRAVLAGVWIGAAPEVAGQKGETVLLRWSGEDAAEGVFDVARGELRSLRVDRPEGELEARFSGSRNPWPDRIEIREKRTGSTLRLRMLSRETAP